MGDFYREIMVKKEKRPVDGLIRIAMIAFTAVLFAAGLVIHPILLVPCIGMGIADYFIIPSLDLEYEYLYVNGDIDVDKIMSRQKRKRAGSYALDDLEIMAKTGSHSLDSVLNGGNQNVKQIDYTSGTNPQGSWTMVFNHSGSREAVRFELEDDIVADLWRRAPRKVIRM